MILPVVRNTGFQLFPFSIPPRKLPLLSLAVLRLTADILCPAPKYEPNCRSPCNTSDHLLHGDSGNSCGIQAPMQNNFLDAGVCDKRKAAEEQYAPDKNEKQSPTPKNAGSDGATNLIPRHLRTSFYASTSPAASTFAAVSICSRVIISVAHHSVRSATPDTSGSRSMPPTIFSSSSRWLHCAGASSVCSTNSWKRGAPVKSSFAPVWAREFSPHNRLRQVMLG